MKSKMTFSYFKRKTIYFHIDEVARDAIVASGLKRKLLEHGISLTYGNRSSSALLARLGRLNQFDAYIFPSLEIFKAACPKPEKIKSPVLILPTESIGGKEEHISRTAAKFFGAFPDENRAWSEKIAAFCTWGENHQKVFTQYAPEIAEKNFLVGHPRMDKICLPPSNFGEISTVKKTIGFMTRFANFNDFLDRSICHMIFHGRKYYFHEAEKVPLRYLKDLDKDIEDILYKDIADFRVMIDLIFFTAKLGHQIELRIHPRENRRVWERLIKENNIPATIAPWDEPFSLWVTSVDHLVSPASTGFYDCFIAGLKPICTNDLIPSRKTHLFRGDPDTGSMLRYVHLPKTFKQFSNIINSPRVEKIKNRMPDKLTKILQFEVGYPECYSSHSNLRDAIEATLNRPGFKPRNLYAYFAFILVQTLQENARGIFKYKEQSSTFSLNFKRINWIDALTLGTQMKGR